MRTRTAAWILIALVGLALTGWGGRGKAGAATAGDIRLSGAGKERRTWSVDGLASLPLQSQDGSVLGEGMQQSIRGKAVLLYDLLQEAKPQFDPKTKRDALRYAVLVHATD